MKSTDSVLVVDDDDIHLAYAVEEVELQSYPCEIARNGREAVTAAMVGSFRLILMDCQMPVMDGFAATREIRKWEEGTGRRVPIVALTSHDDDREREKARAAGMDDFLPKPLATRDLHRMIDQFPGGRRAILWPPPLPDLTPGVQRSPRLIQLFLEHVPEQLEALRIAFVGGSTEQLRVEAHKLKGSCLAIAAEPMARLADELRLSAADGDLRGVEIQIEELRKRFVSVESLVQWELQGIARRSG